MKSTFFSGDKKYYILVLALLAIFAFLVIRFWNITWDDSAITLGFSRNLARYGDIIPSQYSDRVEGYSTFLWMIINSAFFLLGLNEDQVLLSAKVLSTTLTFANILMVAVILREKISSLFLKILILALYVINGITLGAAVFGMETALYATLLLASCLLFAKREENLVYYVAFSMVSSLLILVRHEGAIFLAPFGLVLFFRNPKALFREPVIYVWGTVFLIYHLWHFNYFGEVVTNPMQAKTHWPYQPELLSPGDILGFYIRPLLEFTLHYMLVLVLALAAFFTRDIDSKPRADNTLFLWISLTGLVVMLLTNNYFPTAQRLSYPALPFMLVLLLRKVSHLPLLQLTIKSMLTFSVLLIGAVISIFGILQSFRTPEYIITVDKVKSTAHMATLLQQYLKKDMITYGSPDMGGLLLYEGDGKRIVDFGMLCNRSLAEYGYKENTALEQYLFQQESLDIISAHQDWLTPLLGTGGFLEMYTPVLVITEETERMFFVKRDLLGPMQVTPFSSADSAPEFRDVFIDEEDKTLRSAFLQFGGYVRIDLRNLQQP